MLLAATGADLVAVHGGGGGYSGWMQSAGVSVVADGEPGTAERLTRALDADTGLGVLRYAEAGDELARRTARAADLHRPLDSFPIDSSPLDSSPLDSKENDDA
jgi:urocanate hydratase